MPPPISAEQSKAVVLLLLMHCLLLPPLFCGGFMVGPCFVVHYLVYFCNHLAGRERELVALL